MVDDYIKRKEEIEKNSNYSVEEKKSMATKSEIETAQRIKRGLEASFGANVNVPGIPVGGGVSAAIKYNVDKP